MTMQISLLNRRIILEDLIYKPDFYGRFEDNVVDFLSQTWDLKSMPSEDSRFKDAYGDIWQHTMNNDDWDADYLYLTRLDMLNIPDQMFLRFLEQLVNPMIRSHESQQDYVQLINSHLERDGFRLDVSGEISGYPIYSAIALHGGIRQQVKNLIFASTGLKPEIVLADAVNNDIRITKNEQFCLVYDQPISNNGLLWTDLLKWWSSQGGASMSSIQVERSLYKRLESSLSSPPEKLLFYTYYHEMRPVLERDLPALIPQVYLHYDPYTIGARAGKPLLPRQRMDFLLLLPNARRIVIEVDGKQHYADDDIASPKRYSEMVAEDRELRLRRYEVYRFGGYELHGERGSQVVRTFFTRLYEQLGLLGSG